MTSTQLRNTSGSMYLQRELSTCHERGRVKISRVNTVVEALNIVLQHWVLKLGWSKDHFDNWIITIREEIVADRLKDTPPETTALVRSDLLFALTKKFGVFDDTFANLIIAALANISTEEIMLNVSHYFSLLCVIVNPL